MIIAIDSNWRETGIICKCGEMTYSDGKHRPQCTVCLETVTDAEIWDWLITLPDYRRKLGEKAQA